MDGIEFGDKLDITVKDLDRLIEVLSRFEELITDLTTSFTPEQLLLGLAAICLLTGFSFTVGKKSAEVLFKVPPAFFSLFRRKS